MSIERCVKLILIFGIQNYPLKINECKFTVDY